MPAPGMRVPIPPLQSLIPPWLMKLLIPPAIICAILWFAVPPLFGVRQAEIRPWLIWVCIGWAVYIVLGWIVSFIQARRIERKLRQQAEAQLGAGAGTTKSGVEALEKSFLESLQTLKTTKLGKDATTTLPWFVVLGPSSSGKSTALVESGLNFPFLGQGRNLQTIAATRHCDWWFTDEAVFLDTAGRYTTDTHDQDEWFAFINLLKKHRKGSAINGVILTVSGPEIARMTEDAVQTYAQTLRDRLDELSGRLELVFPIYVMFTKLDQIAGFVEFFDDLAKPERTQIWGTTFPYDGATGEVARDRFEESCSKLNAGLRAHRINALAKERLTERKEKIYLFPRQFAAAQRRWADFIAALFRPNPFQESAIFRGAYFTSAVQKGKPVDLVGSELGTISQEPTQQPSSMGEVEKKNFFLNQMFTRVVIPGRDFVRESLRKKRRRRVMQLTTWSTTGVVFLPVFLLLIVSYANNASLVAQAHTRTQEVAQIAVTPTERIRADGATLTQTLKVLDDLRETLKVLDDNDRHWAPADHGFGLYSGGSVNPKARELYFQQLKTLFLDNISGMLQNEIKTLDEKMPKTSNDFNRLNDITLAYQMLALAGSEDYKPEVLKGVATTVFTEELWLNALVPDPARLTQMQRELALNQLQFFLTQFDRPTRAAWATQMNAPLVANVKKRLGEAIWVGEAYRDLMATLGANRGKITIDTVIPGPPAQTVLVVPAEYQFSDLYTQAGWDSIEKTFDEKAENLTDKFKDLGITKTKAEILTQLQNFYIADYGRVWTNFLNNVQVREFDTPRSAADGLRVLGAPESPYKKLFANIYEQQRLNINAQPYFQVTSDMAWVDEAIKSMEVLEKAVQEFVDRFKSNFIDAARSTNGIGELVRAFSRAREALQTAIRSAPETQRQITENVMMRALLQTRQTLAAKARADANQRWLAEIVEPFNRELRDKFPFSPNDTDDVALGAFSEMFNPQNGRLWREEKILRDLSREIIFEQRLIVLTPAFDHAMKRAETIRDVLYSSTTATRIEMPYIVELVQRRGVRDMVVTVGPESLGLWTNPARKETFTWREDRGSNNAAKLSILIGRNRWVPIFEDAKPWALFRMFSTGQPVPATNDRLFFTWNYDFDDGLQRFEVNAYIGVNRKENPFAPGFFSELRFDTRACE